MSLRASRRWALIPLAVLLGGCGKSGGLPSGSARIASAGAPPAAVAVIAGWSSALRMGRLQKAASYWALPSVMVNGAGDGRLALIRIRTRGQALAADETLPCGATLKATRSDGRYVLARFQLGPRRGAAGAGGCSGLADVEFLIVGGHIRRWLRAPIQAAPVQGARAAALPIIRPLRAEGE